MGLRTSGSSSSPSSGWGSSCSKGSTSASGCCIRSSARTTLEQRVVVNTIGPIWDGNEVWLIVAGAAIFAAFPSWYATMFSTFYLALVIVLVALILRGCRSSTATRSTTPAGGHLAMVVHHRQRADPAAARHGIRRPALRAAHRLSPQLHRELLRAARSLRAVHRPDLDGVVPVPGAACLTLKTDGELHERIARLSGRLGWLAAAVTFGWLTWIHLGLSAGFRPQPGRRVGPVTAVVGAACSPSALRGLGLRRGGWPSPAWWARSSSTLSPGDGVQHQHGIQPHRGQLRQPFVHATGHHRGGSRSFPWCSSTKAGASMCFASGSAPARHRRNKWRRYPPNHRVGRRRNWSRPEGACARPAVESMAVEQLRRGEFPSRRKRMSRTKLPDIKNNSTMHRFHFVRWGSRTRLHERSTSGMTVTKDGDSSLRCSGRFFLSW